MIVRVRILAAAMVALTCVSAAMAADRQQAALGGKRPTKGTPSGTLRGGHPAIVIDAPRPADRLVISAGDFGLVPDGPGKTSTDAEGNREALMRAIAHCRQRNASKLILPKGVYRFTSPRSVRFEDMHDFVFDGQGSELIFSYVGRGSEPAIQILRSARCVFQNFKVDWDWDVHPLATIGRAVNLAGDGSFVDMELHDVEKIDQPRLGYWSLNPLDERLLAPGAGTEIWRLLISNHEILRPGVVRVWPEHRLPVKLGQLYLIRHFIYDRHAFVMGDNAHLTLRDIDIYSFPGMGFVVHGDQHHWELSNCNITHRPGQRRPITCTADGYHVGQSRGFMRIENCDFGYMGDDCINIHDNNSMGIIGVDERTVIAKHVYQWRNPFHVGDLVEFRNPDLSPTGFSSKLTAVQYDHPKAQCRLSFEDRLPANLSPASFLFNRRYDSSNFVIRNCYFHENRARGILVHARDGLIENNRFFHNQHAAVQIETGWQSRWAEGYGAGNLVFRNNVFEQINSFGAYDGVVVYVSVYLPGGRTVYPIFENILFEGNTFVDFPAMAFHLSSCRNLTVRDNVFANPTPLPYRHNSAGIAYVELASDVAIIDNLWYPSPQATYPKVKRNARTVKNLMVRGNRVADR